MNRLILVILAVFWALTGFVNVYAQNAEEKKKEEVSSKADNENREPGRAKKVEERLKEEFNLDQA